LGQFNKALGGAPREGSGVIGNEVIDGEFARHAGKDL
jgi:hypothetical protein